MMLTAHSLGLRRGRDWLFRQLDLTIDSGQMHWLRGANGRGKTSLLRVLVGLSSPQEGEVRNSSAYRPVYLGHASALKEDLTALEALQFLVRLHQCDARTDQLAGALHRLGVDRHSGRGVRTLSQGQKRRVALARLALEDRPGLWVLDEPFDALDDEGCAAVRTLMGEHLQRGGSVLLSSHLPVALPGREVKIIDLDAASHHG